MLDEKRRKEKAGSILKTIEHDPKE
jgi:hypothetical protein